MENYICVSHAGAPTYNNIFPPAGLQKSDHKVQVGARTPGRLPNARPRRPEGKHRD